MLGTEDERPDKDPCLEDETQRVITDLQRHTLEPMKGKFCRLIYLASLRDHNTGGYHHYGLESRYTSQAVDEGLRRCHEESFEALISLSLQEQTQDLLHFFDSIKAERWRLVEVWQRLRAYQVLPPENCHPLARQLFSKNVEIILEVLKATELWELLDDPHRDTDDLT